MAAPREARTLGIKLGAALTIAKEGSDRYYLCRPNGENISDIRADAKGLPGHGPRGRRVPP